MSTRTAWRAIAATTKRFDKTLSGSDHWMMIIDLDDAIASLCARKINCGHQTLWDGGITIWLGDDINGRKAETTLPLQSLGSAGSWLIEAARRLYPDDFLEDVARQDPPRQG